MTSLDGVRSAYDASASMWHDAPSRVYGALAAALVDATPVPLLGAHVVDVGAGTGVATRAALAAGSSCVVAVDLAASMLTVGGLAPAAVVGDVTILPFADGSFDLAVAACVLNHLPDPQAGLVELRRVSRAVVASAFLAGWTHPAKDTVDSLAGAYGFAIPEWYARLKTDTEPLTAHPEALTSLAVAAGWNEVLVRTVSVRTGVVAPADLARWRLGMAHLAPWLAGVPQDVQAELLQQAELALAGAPELVVPLVVLTARAPSRTRRCPCSCPY